MRRVYMIWADRLLAGPLGRLFYSIDLLSESLKRIDKLRIHILY